MADAAVFGEVPEPPAEIFGVRMSGQATEDLHFGSQVVFSIMNSQARVTFLDAAAERVFGLVANQHDRIPFAADRVPQMMRDSARFAHATGCDHQVGYAQIVQGFRLINGTYISEMTESKWILRLAKRSTNFFVEAVLMFAEHFRHIYGKWTIYKNRN